MREKILTDHLKERNNDLNHLDSEFGQEEKVLEEEIIILKIQLEEAKRESTWRINNHIKNPSWRSKENIRSHEVLDNEEIRIGWEYWRRICHIEK